MNCQRQDTRDFIHLSICTGLRISDVVVFDISERFEGNDIFLRMHKTSKPLYAWIGEARGEGYMSRPWDTRTLFR